MFDIYTLLFLLIAIIIFLRLRSVLGTRTGHERPPLDIGQQKDTAQKDTPYESKQDKGDNIITLPKKDERGDDAEEINAPPKPEERLGDVVPKGSSVEKALINILSKDQNFDPQEFLSGAKIAYEMIVTAFAQNDKKTLKPLLAQQVYESFEDNIDERKKNKQSIDFTFIGIDQAKLTQAELDENEAFLTVRFKSQLISLTKDEKGDVISGDPQAIDEVVDLWTFKKDLNEKDPNWKLVATQSS